MTIRRAILAVTLIMALILPAVTEAAVLPLCFRDGSCSILKPVGRPLVKGAKTAKRKAGQAIKKTWRFARGR